MIRWFYGQQIESEGFQEYLEKISTWIVVKEITPAWEEYFQNNSEGSHEEDLNYQQGNNFVTNDINAEAQAIISTKYNQLSFIESAKTFLIIWIEHILWGLDHILFVIALILVLPPIKHIISMLTVFTLAHSLTIILAWTKTLTLSPKIVEPIIALSIAYTVITTVFFKKNNFFNNYKKQLIIIFIFALFHWLGFAGGFTHINIPENNFISSLLFFNIWIELGQIIVVILTLPMLIWLSKYKNINDNIIKVSAIIISLLSIFWIIQRIFF